jgi:molecular chaperone HtpG
MREQFRVDLRGLVEVLSHHLYSSERVYLRELVQNARDAVEARRRLGDDFEARIEIQPAWGSDPLVVRDNGVGLTGDDMRSLLSMIGGTSKRDDLVAARTNFLGQFGIGLLSCFLVADSIEVVSRSVHDPDAPTVQWVGSSDGTFTITEALTPLRSPGTEVRLQPRRGAYRWCDDVACAEFATEFAELLDDPVYVGGRLVSQQVPPWELSTEQQLAWCQERFGFEAMGIIPLDSASATVTGLAFVLPYTARPGYRTGDRIYAKGMLVADTDDLVVPRWAFFCRAVIDAADLPLTASREALQESTALQLARQRVGFRLLTELILVHAQHPEVYRDIIGLHADGLKALAVQEPDVRDLIRTTFPYATSQGERTVQKLIDNAAPIPYVSNADTYHALADVAAHAGLLLINASGLYEAQLLQIINETEHQELFREVTDRDVVALIGPVPHADATQAATLAARAEHALRGENLTVRVASFEPADRSVLWWPAVLTPSGDRQTDDTSKGDTGATLVLNAASSAVKHLLGAPAEAEIGHSLRALYVTALLLSRYRPSDEQVSLLSTAVIDMIETTVLGDS